MAVRRDEGPVIILSTNGDGTEEFVPLDLTREQLTSCYGFFEANPPGQSPIALPFPAELIRAWNVLHSECAFYLRAAVLPVLDYLELRSIPIELMEWQHDAHDAAMTCLIEYNMYSDVTPLGGGKTYNTSKIAQILDPEHVISVSPAGVISVWDDQRCALPRLKTMSYGEVRGIRKNGGGEEVVTELRHGFLTRTDWSTTHNTKKGPIVVDHVRFEATPLWHTMCKEGLFLICDEVQNIKNDSAQQKAIRALMKVVRSYETAYSAFLSGSPFDKEEGAYRMMQTLNVIESDQLIRVLPRSKTAKMGQVIQMGMKEAILFCQGLERKERARRKIPPIKGTTALERFIDSPLTNQICRILPQKKEEAMAMIYELYMKIVVPAVVIAAPRPHIDFVHDIANGFYTFDQEDALRYLIQMSDIRGAFTTLDSGTIINDFTTLGRCLELMEYSSLPSIAKDMTRVLDARPHARGLTFLTYKKNYDRLLELLPGRLVEKGVEIVNGSIAPHNRTPMIDAFQSGTSRIMLIGLVVGGVGLNLHDRRGDMETHSWIVPGYSCIDDYQASGRTYRPGVRSNCYTRFVYCRQHPAVHLLSMLQNKSGVIRDAINRGDILLPDSYRNLKIPEGTKMTLPPLEHKD